MKSIVLFLFSSALYANTLYVKNDSPYTLSATVVGATGENLGQMTIATQGEFEWSDPYGGQTQQGSTTPYTVIWTCQSGLEYGTNYQVAAGATTTAQSSAGPRYCESSSNGGS